MGPPISRTTSGFTSAKFAGANLSRHRCTPPEASVAARSFGADDRPVCPKCGKEMHLIRGPRIPSPRNGPDGSLTKPPGRLHLSTTGGKGLFDLFGASAAFVAGHSSCLNRLGPLCRTCSIARSMSNFNRVGPMGWTKVHQRRRDQIDFIGR